MKIFLSTPPSMAVEALHVGETSLMAYRMGAGFHLYGTNIPDGRFELMEVGCAGFTGYGPQELLALELLHECSRRGYSGIALDITSPPTRPLVSFCRTLEGALERAGLSLLLPGAFGRYTESAGLIFQDAPHYGTFRERLARLTSRYGSSRVYVALERVYRDYALPSAKGRIVDASAIRGLAARRSGWHISNYASYYGNGRAHVVFWDDAATLREKLSVMAGENIAGAFLYYPHVRDIAGEFLR